MPAKINANNSYPVDFTEEEVIEYCNRLGIAEPMRQFAFDHNYDQLWRWFSDDCPLAAIYFRQIVAADAVLRIFTWNPISLHEVYFLLKSLPLEGRVNFDGNSRYAQPETSLPVHSIDIYFDLMADDENKTLAILERIFDQFESLPTRTALNSGNQLRTAGAEIKDCARRFYAAERAGFPDKNVQYSLRNPPLLLQNTGFFTNSTKPLLLDALPKVPKQVWKQFNFETSSYLDLLQYLRSRPSVNSEDQNADLLVQNIRQLIKQKVTLCLSGWCHYPTALAEVIKCALIAGEKPQYFKICRDIIKILFLIDEYTWFFPVSKMAQENSPLAALIAEGQAVREKSRKIPRLLSVSIDETKPPITYYIHGKSLTVASAAKISMRDGAVFTAETRLLADVLKDTSLKGEMEKIFIKNFTHTTDIQKEEIFNKIIAEKYGASYITLIRDSNINLVGFDINQIADENMDEVLVLVNRSLLAILNEPVRFKYPGIMPLVSYSKGYILKLENIVVLNIFEGASLASIGAAIDLGLECYPFQKCLSPRWMGLLKNIYKKIYPEDDSGNEDEELTIKDDIGNLSAFNSSSMWRTLKSIILEDLAKKMSAKGYGTNRDLVVAFFGNAKNEKILYSAFAKFFVNSNDLTASKSEFQQAKL